MKTVLIAIASLTLGLAPSITAQTVEIPASFAWPRSDAKPDAPGFKVRVAQADIAEVGFVRLEASSARAEAQLAGLLINPSTRQPYADVSDKSAYSADGTYSEPATIDYEQAGGATALFPGIPESATSKDDFSLEAVAFLDLQPGTYSMIVNSDDGFQVTAGRDARDWFGRIVVGEAEGGRSAADTTFSFSISQAGLYSFRLLYYEAGGGANVSWYASEDRVLVNDASGLVKSYREITEPRPTYIRYVSPAPGATNVAPSVAIQAQIGDGDSVQVNPASVELFINDAKVAAAVEKVNSITKVSFVPPGLLPALSTVKVRLAYRDTAATSATRTEQYSFKVSSQASIDLPAPLYFENFDSTAEGALPAGWSTVSYTDESGSSAELDFGNLDSAAYAKWTVVNVDRFRGSFVTYSDPNNPAEWENDYKRVLSFNPANIVNGVVVTNLATGRFVFGDSGYRNGASQVLYLYTPDFNLTGKTNVFLSFHSLWEQNQDSMGAVEYSIDGGQSWLPLAYFLDSGDVVKDESGQVDAVATFNNEQADAAKYTDPSTGDEKGGTFGAFIAAPISQALAPYISARRDDDAVGSKRVEVFPLDKADNQARVRFRFAHAGTDSWYFGMDDFGIYTRQSPASTLKLAALRQDGKIALSWTGGPNVLLQKTSTLTSPSWQDVTGTAGTSSFTENFGSTPAFYRLVQR